MGGGLMLWGLGGRGRGGWLLVVSDRVMEGGGG